MHLERSESGLGALDQLVECGLRSASILMKPERLAAIQPSRISASRAFVEQMIKERWSIMRTRFRINADGEGEALYHIVCGGWEFSFPIYSFKPTTAGRTFRIIGTAWDMMGALVEGRISDADFETTRQEMPKLYRGRATPGTLAWFRANRSARVFDDCLTSLSGGLQPEAEMLWDAGYTMRNTGLDGNGTFGTKAFVTFEKDHPLRWSLSAQMLAAYMMRVFATDILNHLAREIGGSNAVPLDPEMSRYLGVGNGSALGLMFFVNNRPKLVNKWLLIREKAIAQAKMLDLSENCAPLDRLIGLVDRAITYRMEDTTPYGRYPPSSDIAAELVTMKGELERLRKQVASGANPSRTPLVGFCKSIEGRYGAHAIETLMSLLIDLVPDYADAQVKTLVVDEEITGAPEMSVGHLRDIIHSQYGWAFGMDLSSDASRRFIWYKSRNAEEPRRGPRADIDEAYELGLDLSRLVVALDAKLTKEDPTTSVARFLLRHPDSRFIVSRIQSLDGLNYHSPHANIMSEDFIPAHITKLLNSGIHGLDKTVDAMDRVIRGVLFQGAPLPEEIASGTASADWANPPRTGKK